MKLQLQFVPSAADKYKASSPAGLPAATVNLVVHVQAAATGRDIIPAVAVVRTPGANVQTVTIPGVPAGDYVVVVVALAADDAVLGFFTQPTTLSPAADTTLEVASAVSLSRLEISPTQSSIKQGASQTYTLTAGFSDQSRADVTDAAVWTSSSTDVAAMSTETKGVATGISPGTTTVTATLGGMSSSAVLRVVSVDTPGGSTGTLPTAPRNLLATVEGLGARHVRISWSPPESDGGSALTGYWLEYRTSDGSVGGGSGVAADQTSFEFTGLPPGATFSWSIAAENGVGRGPAAVGNSVVVPADTGQLPGPPRNLLAAPGASARRVTISFDPPESDGGSPITGYWLEYRTSDGSVGGGSGMSPNQTTFEFTSLPPGTTFTWSVAAENGVGRGPALTGNSVVVP